MTNGLKNNLKTRLPMKYYRLLGVDRLATVEEIKAAYRALAMKYHPDRNIGNEEEAERTFKEIQKAYETLMERRSMFTPNLQNLRSHTVNVNKEEE